MVQQMVSAVHSPPIHNISGPRYTGSAAKEAELKIAMMAIKTMVIDMRVFIFSRPVFLACLNCSGPTTHCSS